MSSETANKGAEQQEAPASTSTSTSTSADQTKNNNNDRGASPPRSSRSTSAIPQLSRSRKGSQEFSPTRTNALSNNLSTIPSAAAVQRALSAQRPIIPHSSVDGVLETSRQDRPFRSGQNSPAWPTSPRLKSPPPSASGIRNTPAKKNESEQTPNTSLKRQATPISSDTSATAKPSDSPSQQVPHPNLRVPARTNPNSTLETVAESSVPSTPSIGPAPSPAPESKIDADLLDNADLTSEASTTKDGEGSGDGEPKQNLPVGDGDNKTRAAPSSSSRPAPILAKRSLTNLTPKPKPPDPPRTMTVETEPVTSLPQLLGDRGTSGRDGSGSVRTKPSSETIRPKKDKKKSSRKATSLHSGTASSKADLFEAKVASAVDEADTSDSDETFVYESNPPDSRSHRHHSRTPSATSLAGQDQHGRNRHGLRSGSHAIGGKKSMKFSNSAYNNHLDEENGEGRGGSVRTTTPRHHHIGRHGKAAHTSILDTNSPFTQATKSNSPRTSTGNAARSSRPNSPRVSNGRLSSSPKKPDAFDVYDDVADDERAPLMGSVRVNRSRHSRRPYNTGLRNSDFFDDDDERGCCGRWGSSLVLGLVVMIICIGVAMFVVGLSQPLLSVKVRHLQNILASEQELMLDIHVDAVNTNIFAITVNDLDVNLFAESAYVGTALDWEKEHRHLRWGQRSSEDDASASVWPWPPFGADDGVDEGTDPIDDDDPDSPTQKMLLGRILEFDSPLIFEASPVRRAKSSSVGEIRLPKPGNKTEVGGSARWERVLQHPFELIVRGVIQYQLPLSSKRRSVKIAGRAKIYPDDDESNPPGNDTTTALLF